ncbi:MFS transporter [Achromobacter xylosoxidans]
MNDNAQPAVRARKPWPAVFSIAVSSFSLVSAEFLPVGLLNAMAADLGISVGTAGLLVAASGLLAAISAPALTILAGQRDRRQVLLALSLLLTLSNLLSMTATGLPAMLAARVLLGIAVGGFWSLGASTANRLAPAGSEARATSVVYAGISVGIVLGVPLGTLIGQELGWRNAFARRQRRLGAGLCGPVCQPAHRDAGDAHQRPPAVPPWRRGGDHAGAAHHRAGQGHAVRDLHLRRTLSVRRDGRERLFHYPGPAGVWRRRRHRQPAGRHGRRPYAARHAGRGAGRRDLGARAALRGRFVLRRGAVLPAGLGRGVRRPAAMPAAVDHAAGGRRAGRRRGPVRDLRAEFDRDRFRPGRPAGQSLRRMPDMGAGAALFLASLAFAWRAMAAPAMRGRVPAGAD